MAFDYLSTSQFGATLNPPMTSRRVRDFCSPDIIPGLVTIPKGKYNEYWIPKWTGDPRKPHRGPDKKRRKKRSRVSL